MRQAFYDAVLRGPDDSLHLHGLDTASWSVGVSPIDQSRSCRREGEKRQQKRKKEKRPVLLIKQHSIPYSPSMILNKRIRLRKL